MSKFLNDNGDGKAIAIPRVISGNSLAKKKKKRPWNCTFCAGCPVPRRSALSQFFCMPNDHTALWYSVLLVFKTMKKKWSSRHSGRPDNRKERAKVVTPDVFGTGQFDYR